MAMQTTVSPSVVGNAFVEQYYHILHHSPEVVYRFYQDASVLSRQDPTGVMSSVTTQKDINDKICSLDYRNYKAEIQTADAQKSISDGVVVLVTGCLTGKDKLRRKFVQTFFLAPQDKGYYVLNDVFRYVDGNEAHNNLGTVNGTDDAPIFSLTPDPEPAQVLDPPAVAQETSHTEVILNGSELVHEQVKNDEHVEKEWEIEVECEPHSHDTHNTTVVEPVIIPDAQEDAPKKSYAYILSSQTKKQPTKIYYVPATTRSAPPTTKKQAVISVAQAPAPAPAPEALAPIAPGSTTELEDKHAQDEVDDGHSIYVRNLPLNITPAELEVEFKKFGPIKQGGVQVRSNKQQGFCFGFVEFQDISSMHSAIQASPVTIGDYQSVVEIKRTTTRVGSSRGRFSYGRGFRNDGFRGRGNFNGGRGYGRNEFGGRGDFSGHGRSRGGENYQQGRGRGARRGGGSIQNVPST